MYTRGPDTGRERVLTQRRGNGDDGAGGGCARARALMLLRPLSSREEAPLP